MSGFVTVPLAGEGRLVTEGRDPLERRPARLARDVPDVTEELAGDEPAEVADAEGVQGERAEEAAPIGARRKGGPKRPKPSEAARAWLERQEAEKRRKPLVIATAAQAIEVWRGVQLSGGPKGSVMPADAGDRAASRGRPIPLQVWSSVRSTEGYDRWRKGLLSDADFEEAIALWPLPKTFYSPLAPLCDVELEELAKGRAEIERQLEREDRGDEERRLMPGMRSDSQEMPNDTALMGAE